MVIQKQRILPSVVDFKDDAWTSSWIGWAADDGSPALLSTIELSESMVSWRLDPDLTLPLLMPTFPCSTSDSSHPVSIGSSFTATAVPFSISSLCTGNLGLTSQPLVVLWPISDSSSLRSFISCSCGKKSLELSHSLLQERRGNGFSPSYNMVSSGY